MSPEEYERLNQFVKVHLIDPERPAWIILAPWGIGETVLFMSLAHSFQQTHGHPITVVVSPAHWPIAKMYEHRLFKILLGDQNFLRYMARSGFIPRDRFELNFPITACWVDLGPRFSQGIQYLGHFPGRGGISDTDLMRFLLRLPWNAHLERPTIPAEWVDSARELANEREAREKQTVVIFPANNTNPVLPDVFWKTLAARLKHNGFKVLTNMAGTHAKNSPPTMPIEGTQAVDLSLHIGVPFVNFAGRVITGSNGMHFLISTCGLPDTKLTVLLTASSGKNQPSEESSSFNFRNIVSQSFQYAAPELYKRTPADEFIIPFDTSEAELKRLAIVVADLELDDESHFKRYESNGKLFVDEHSDWLDALAFA